MENKKIVLFTYTEHTVPSTVSLMKRLLAMFPEKQFSTRLLQLSGEHPDKMFQEYIHSVRRDLYLYFSFDCLGFTISSFDDTPFLNTLWTPCATYLTLPAAMLDRELSREMNMNVTLLCMTKSEEKYIRSHYPDYVDVRTVMNPMQSIQPLYSALLSLTERYPLRS